MLPCLLGWCGDNDHHLVPRVLSCPSLRSERERRLSTGQEREPGKRLRHVATTYPKHQTFQSDHDHFFGLSVLWFSVVTSCKRPLIHSLIFMFASCTFDFSCAVSGLCQDMLVFTVMQSKVKIKAVQIKSKIWEMKGGKYAKTLPKIQLKLMELCMETPCRCPSYPDGHPGGWYFLIRG